MLQEIQYMPIWSAREWMSLVLWLSVIPAKRSASLLSMHHEFVKSMCKKRALGSPTYRTAI